MDSTFPEKAELLIRNRVSGSVFSESSPTFAEISAVASKTVFWHNRRYPDGNHNLIAMNPTEPHRNKIEELVAGDANAKVVFAEIGTDWGFVFHTDLQAKVLSALAGTRAWALLRRWRLRRLYRLSQRRLALLCQTAGTPTPRLPLA